MTALPPINEVNLKLNLDHHSTAISLYRLVLQAETAALEANQTTNLIHSRIFGYLILFPVGDQARAYVLKEIASCDSKHASVQSLNDALYILGGHYCDFLIRLFYSPRRRTPASSGYVSRPSFDNRMEKINEDLQHPSRSHQTAKSQVHTSGLQPFQSLLGHISAQQALARDGFRCMASGVFDLHLVNPQTVEVPRLSLALTQCCHIFPESLYDFKGVVDRNRKTEYTATVWTIMSQFGYPQIRQQLEGDQIHRLENVMTLHPGIHVLFEEMKLCFKAVENQENTYSVKLFHPMVDDIVWSLHIPTNVTFVAHSANSPRPLPLPDPSYLRIHAACCRIAHMSGAAEYFEQIFRDLEGLDVLDEDGQSADTLSLALLRLVPPIASNVEDHAT